MAPIIEVSDSVCSGLDALGISYTRKDETRDDFIYIPSINLYVAKERTHSGLNWNDSHKALEDEGRRMLTPSEFRATLKHLVSNPRNREHTQIYNEITEVKSPWRAEWIDAYFEQRDDGMYLLTGNKTKAEKLDKSTLMNDRTPGISLDSWIEGSDEEVTSQGLPSKKITKGDLYHWYPRNNVVAIFYALSVRALLYFGRLPSFGCDDLGVRAAEQRE